MTGQGVFNGSRYLAIAWLTRFPPRLRREGRHLGLLILGHFTIFLLALGHDEIVAECVANGTIPAQHAELLELAIGLALFLCWSALTIAIVRLIDRARADARG
ncbi:hypothetical protein [Roseovarius ramblicola]|uniref:Uncharacterized protein n=1 Tax=Roseovarius ramblicola TaxID=2022336 RepID=A0ABV5I1S8_9RHOB